MSFFAPTLISDFDKDICGTVSTVVTQYPFNDVTYPGYLA